MAARPSCHKGAASETADGRMVWRSSCSTASWLPFVLYLVLAGSQAYWFCDELNPDGVSYLRNASYLLDGRYLDSVSGYWSPLLSWCLVPFLSWGIDGLHAARIVLFASGLLMCWASLLVVRRSATQHPWLPIIVVTLVALSASRHMRSITPDLLMSAILMLYFSVVLTPDFLRNWRLQSLAGTLGGLAYLAKSYALPFFLVHLPFTLLVLGGATELPRKRLARSWGMAMLFFALTTGGWIGLLSWKYEKPTFSTVARVAHTLIGPEDKPRMHAWSKQLFEVVPERISAWETPEILPYNHWSPFSSRRYFLHQIKYTTRTAFEIVEHLSGYDVLRLTLAILILGPLATWMPSRETEWRHSVWYLGTVILFCSGFVLVYYEARYIDGLLTPLCVIYCLGFASQFIGQATYPKWHGWVFVGLLATSFLIAEGYQCVSRLPQPRSGKLCREIAFQLKADGSEGPIASAPGYSSLGMGIAYHLGQPFLGGVPTCEAAQVESLLNKFGVQVFVAASASSWTAQSATGTWDRLSVQWDDLGRDAAPAGDVFVRRCRLPERPLN